MKNQNSTIAIIGGGYTGLTAAYRLSQQGFQVTIFEKSHELGGLAGDFQIQGRSLEKTYHHIFRTDTQIIALAKELGLEKELLWLESSIAIYNGNAIYPFMGPIDLIRFKPLSFINRIRTGLVVLYLQKNKKWEQFTKISAYDWMAKYAGKQSMQVIWEPLLKGKFDTFYNKVSMAWLWARLHIRANSRERGESKEKLGYFEYGFQSIVKALTQKLKEKKVEIVLNANIISIDEDTNKPKIVLADGSTQQFDRIIATIPSSIFGKLVEKNPSASQTYISQLNSINYIGAVCMIFSSDQDISKYYWHNINDLTAPFLVFINHTKLVPKSHYKGKNLYYIGAYVPHDHRYFTMDNDEIYALWFAHLKKIFPEFDSSILQDKFIFKLRNAQHIVDLDYQAKIPEYCTPIKNVYLSNFSQIYPEDRGTNYAVNEGNNIAKLVTESFK